MLPHLIAIWFTIGKDEVQVGSKSDPFYDSAMVRCSQTNNSARTLLLFSRCSEKVDLWGRLHAFLIIPQNCVDYVSFFFFLLLGGTSPVRDDNDILCRAPYTA